MGIRAKIYKWLLSGYQRESDANVPMKQEYKGVRRGSKVRSLSALDDLNEINLDTQGIYFKVIPGSGGIAVEVSHYDTRSERDITTLHIVPEGDELSEALAKIITLEAMKR